MAEHPSDGKSADAAQAAPANHLQTICDAVTDAVCLIDLEGTILKGNRAFARLFQLAPQEVEGRHCCALLAGKPERHPNCPLVRMLSTKSHEESEFLVAGRPLWVGVDPVLDAGGSLVGAVHVISDLSERRRGVASLHQSEERYRHALNSLPDPVFVKDEDHRWTILNEAFCRLMGHSREELLGKSDFDFFPREEAAVFWKKDDEVFASGEENVNDEYFTDGAGVRHRISTKKSIFRESETGKRILVGVIRDVTEPKRVEEELRRYRDHLEDMVRERTAELGAANDRLVREAQERELTEVALRESETRFRGFVENAQIGVYRMTPGGRVVLANAKLASIFGFPSTDDLLREHLEDWPARSRLDLAPFRTMLDREGVISGLESTVTRPDGTAIPIRLYGRAIRDDDGSVRFYEGTVEDLTDQKALEAQLRQSQKMEAVGSLAGGVAHDFNNFLQAMLSHTQLLHGHSDDPEKVVAIARELEGQIDRAASLSRQLLVFSRRETVKPERLDLNRAVRDAAEMLRRLVRANIAVATELAPGRLPVEADRAQLEQVLMNLTLNASDAMPEGGSLVIRTGATNDAHVWLSVRDTGHGIPDPIRQRIFEPFFTTKGAGKGTGLGLSVVHGIVTQHGGRIEVESATGLGSTFTVVLPRAASPEAPADDAAQPATPHPEVGRGERVLVVEDEAAAREGLRQILVSLGYDVVAFGSGEEARRVPPDQPADVLLTDLMLPGVGGAELAMVLKERWPALKVILMSGYAEDEAVRLGVLAGVVRFLQKPFDMATLAHELRQALDSER